MAEALADDVLLDLEVLVDEVPAVGVVGEDPPDVGGGEDDDLGLLCVEELAYSHGIQQVQLGMCAPDELGEAAGLELAPDG